MMRDRLHHVSKYVPSVLVKWHQDVKHENLNVECCMFSVLRLVYIQQALTLSAVGMTEGELAVRKRKIETRMVQALSNLEHVLTMEYEEYRL